MSGRSDIEHLQELVVQLSPEDAELINRLERTRLTLESALAGIRRPSTHDETEHHRRAAGDSSSKQAQAKFYPLVSTEQKKTNRASVVSCVAV